MTWEELDGWWTDAGTFESLLRASNLVARPAPIRWRHCRVLFRKRTCPPAVAQVPILNSELTNKYQITNRLARLIPQNEDRSRHCSLNVGGPARHVVWLTKGLQSAECESLLVAGTVLRAKMTWATLQRRWVWRLSLFRDEREISTKDALTIWRLYKLLRREQPDIVHTHTAKAGTVGRVAGWMYRWLTPKTLLGQPRACRFVHTYHGHIFHSYYGPLKTRLFLLIEKTLARLVTDRIVVLSEQQRREINEEFKVGRARQVSVIPLGLDVSVFAGWRERGQSFRAELGVRQTKFSLGCWQADGDKEP